MTLVSLGDKQLFPYPAKTVTRSSDRAKPVAQTARDRFKSLFCLLDNMKSAIVLLIFLLSNPQTS